MKTTAYGNQSPTLPITKIQIERRSLTASDVAIDIAYCGICHSDIHTAKGDWGDVKYPCVPGHEIVGKVQAVGTSVSAFKVGDTVGVGCMVDACGSCKKCKSGNENYCANVIWTYASKDRDGTDTKGGYSEHIIVDQAFVVPIPEGMSEAETAPLLCAGITMYSPLKHWQADNSKKVGIIGVGGLGHMGLKIAKAMGAEVTAITTNSAKESSAKEYGADKVLVSTSDEQMSEYADYFDLIIDTAPGKHDLNQYINLLGFNGTIVLVGAIATDMHYAVSNTLTNRRSIAGSGIGSIGETKEMLTFCKEHNIYPKIDIIAPDKINDAWQSIVDKKIDHRYVIKMQ